MDVWRITVATLRRWYIFLPLLALTFGAVHVAGEGVAPEYEVTGTALITPGRTQSPVPNPYGSQDDANVAVAIVLNSPESRAAMPAEGLLPGYEVTNRSRSTVMNISVRGGDAEQAVATGNRVLEMALGELESRQSGAGMPASAQYRLDVLAAPAVVGVAYDGKLQVQAVVGLIGASLALLVAVLFDDIVGLYRRHRARRRAHGKRRDHGADESASTPGPQPWDDPTPQQPQPLDDVRPEQPQPLDDVRPEQPQPQDDVRPEQPQPQDDVPTQDEMVPEPAGARPRHARPRDRDHVPA